MSRTTFALAAITAAVAGLAATGAQAQTSAVTLYGLIDTTISTVSNTNAAGARTTGFQVPWFSGSRWGLTGKEDLGGGTSAIFKLESEFETPTGNMDTPGVLFNRDAWVGLSNPLFGKLTFGRQNALARDVSGIYGDPYTSAEVTLDEGGYTNVNNFKQLIFYAGSATGTRLNNGVVWKKLWDGGFFTGLAYQFGEVPGQFSQNTTESAALGYNGGNFHLAAFAQQAKVNGFTDRSYSLGGKRDPGHVPRQCRLLPLHRRAAGRDRQPQGRRLHRVAEDRSVGCLRLRNRLPDHEGRQCRVQRRRQHA